MSGGSPRSLDTKRSNKRLLSLGDHLSDAQAIANQRIGSRSAALAQNGRSKATCVIDDLVNRQKERSVIKLANQFQFAIEDVSYLRRYSLGEACFNPLFAEGGEGFMRCCIAFRISSAYSVLRNSSSEKLQRSRKCCVSRMACGASTKQARHFSWWLQNPLGIGFEPPARIFQSQMLANAGYDVLQFSALRRMIEDVIDGNERNESSISNIDQPF